MRKTIPVLLLSICITAYAQLPVSDLQQKSGEILGQLSIPSIKLKQVVREGVDISIIDKGVSHWAGSPLPGQFGNTVLAGHRSTKTAPFLKIENLKIGDKILFIREKVVTEYEVYDKFIVNPKDVSIIYPPSNTKDSIITIFTCHPIGSKTKRFVVRARLSRN